VTDTPKVPQNHSVWLVDTVQETRDGTSCWQSTGNMAESLDKAHIPALCSMLRAVVPAWKKHADDDSEYPRCHFVVPN
jgi:hypothetical protein